MKDELVSPSATPYVAAKADGSGGSALSQRRTTWNYIKALMWKNALLKRRH
ncbi:Abc transporter a family member 1, partial [Globisporangium polare]